MHSGAVSPKMVPEEVPLAPAASNEQSFQPQQSKSIEVDQIRPQVSGSLPSLHHPVNQRQRVLVQPPMTSYHPSAPHVGFGQQHVPVHSHRGLTRTVHNFLLFQMKHFKKSFILMFFD